MYIALKWLVTMALAMWIALCVIERCNKYEATNKFAEYIAQNNLMHLEENSSILIRQSSFQSTENINYPVKYNENNVLQYVMFVAGACLVLIYNRKNDFILYTKRKMKIFEIHQIFTKMCKINFEKTARITSVAIFKFMKTSMYIFKQLNLFLIFKQQSKRKSQNINLVLLNKLKDIRQERKNLGQLLIVVIEENKNIRMQFQLATMARKRLLRSIEDTQKQLKENKSRYFSFQHLYLVTHQENIFLKSRVKKLTEEKEDAERNLFKLVNHVWHSKNKELQAYCSRFIVRSGNDLLNSDVKAEIDQFLRRSSKNKQVLFNKPTNPTCTAYTHNLCYDIVCKEESTVALIEDAPKLRGLPGEYVWTIKDKDGIIEKLYEYEGDFDNGDTIKRIREYSVYCDKDCLLDFTGSATLIHNINLNLHMQYRSTKRITGSQAFQMFLQKNKNILRPRLSGPPPP